jgi:hypothetical protein
VSAGPLHDDYNTACCNTGVRNTVLQKEPTNLSFTAVNTRHTATWSALWNSGFRDLPASYVDYVSVFRLIFLSLSSGRCQVKIALTLTISPYQR